MPKINMSYVQCISIKKAVICSYQKNNFHISQGPGKCHCSSQD